MFDTERFSKIRNLQDIRLEKARLRYEMLAAENRLSQNLKVAGQLFSLSALISRVRLGMTIARKTYDVISRLIGWIMRKKKNDGTESRDVNHGAAS